MPSPTGAELRDLDPAFHRGTHDRRAFRNGDAAAVDGQRDLFFRIRLRGSEVDLFNERWEVGFDVHLPAPIQQPRAQAQA
jgi:hypothetical protein